MQCLTSVSIKLRFLNPFPFSSNLIFNFCFQFSFRFVFIPALASAHHRRIVGEAICRLPQPRVERIRRDPWKIYTPHCTVLHRCADDTGCCPSERQTCAPKRTKTVDLYFFVSTQASFCFFLFIAWATNYSHLTYGCLSGEQKLFASFC